MTWQHDHLQHDLADTRRACGEIVGEKVGLQSWGSGGEADVAAVRPSWNQPRPTIYEVKISRADLLSDLRSEKWRRYLPYCERLYFAVPAGMADRREIPIEAGFMVRGANGWSVLRAPRRQPAEQRQDLVFAMLLKDHPAPWRRPPRAERIRLMDGADSPVEMQRAARRVSSRIEALVADARDARSLRERLTRIEALLRPLVPNGHWHTAEYLAEWCAERLSAQAGQGGNVTRAVGGGL